MTALKPNGSRLSEKDLDFVVEEAAPEFEDKARLKRLIREDEAFRKGLISDENVFKRVMAEEEAILKISPALYFEILLRRSLREMEKVGHTFERTGSGAVPVFDAKGVVNLLSKEPVLQYLADMLASFTKIESYVIPVRVRKGVWRKLRFNDMDVDSLSRLSDAVDEEQRFGYYKRIADVCLFILGIFPEFAQFDYRYPASGQIRRKVGVRFVRSMEDYEEEGKKFYKLAAEHDSARALELSTVFWLLHENFSAAKKPLSFISEHYLHYKRHRLFEVEAEQ